MSVTVSGDIELDDIRELAIKFHPAWDLTLFIPGPSYLKLLTDPEVSNMLFWTSPLEITEPAIRIYGVKVTPYA